MNVFVNETVRPTLRKLYEQWSEISTNGYDLISSLITLSIESQYMNSPHWGVLKHQSTLHSLLSTRIYQQSVNSIVELQNMTYYKLNSLLDQMNELLQLCIQFKEKYIQQQMNEGRWKDQKFMESCVEKVNRMIEQVKHARNLFANDWNMKAMIVEELKLYISKDEDIINKKEDYQHDEQQMSSSQRKLIYYCQSWKLQPYLSAFFNAEE
jgi:hypothetical protein